MDISDDSQIEEFEVGEPMFEDETKTKKKKGKKIMPKQF